MNCPKCGSGEGIQGRCEVICQDCHTHLLKWQQSEIDSLKSKNDILYQRNVDAGLLHLADEQSILNMQRVIDSLKKENTGLVHAIELCGDMQGEIDSLKAQLAEAERAMKSIMNHNSGCQGLEEHASSVIWKYFTKYPKKEDSNEPKTD